MKLPVKISFLPLADQGFMYYFPEQVMHDVIL